MGVSPTSSRSSPRRLVVCADDYALAPGVSRAILALVQQGRINATSCMTASPFWPEHAAWLREASGPVPLEVGLHLTFTDQAPLGPMPLLAPQGQLPPMGHLLGLALRGQLPRAELGAEMERQLESFAGAMGRLPDFVDGHHHVQQFPGLREELLALLGRHGDWRPWVRVCHEPLFRVLRRGVEMGRALSIGWLGPGLRRRLRRGGWASNPGFIGIYGPRPGFSLAGLLPRMLRDAVDGTVLMCHPGWVDQELTRRDVLTYARQEEFDFLAGDGFIGLLVSRGLTLGPACSGPASP